MTIECVCVKDKHSLQWWAQSPEEIQRQARDIDVESSEIFMEKSKGKLSLESGFEVIG